MQIYVYDNGQRHNLIEDILDNGTPLFTDAELPIADSSYRYSEIMGDDNCVINFSLPVFFEFPIGCCINVDNTEYTLVELGNVTKQNERNYEYSLTFESPAKQLSRYKFRNHVDGRLNFTLTAQPQEYITHIITNLNQREGSNEWMLGDCIVSSEKTQSFSHNTILDALNAVAQLFETEWEIVNKTISLKKVEYNKANPITLSYGRGNGFISGIARQLSGEKAVDVLWVEGGDRNIDSQTYTYQKTISGQTQTLHANKLRLPRNAQFVYVPSDNEPDQYGIISRGTLFTLTEWNALTPEQRAQYPDYMQVSTDEDGFGVSRSTYINNGYEESLEATDIYPKKVLTVTDVTESNPTNHFFEIKDSNNDVNYADCIIGGEQATIIFESGMLTGKEFNWSKYTHSTKQFDIVPQEIDGITMPDRPSGYIPVVGDTFAVFHIALPQQYITNAEQELLLTACEYLWKHGEVEVEFNGTVDGIWAKSNWESLAPYFRIGGYINFTDNAFCQDGKKMRILSVKTYLSNPHSPEITLSNSSVSQSVSSELKKIPQNQVSAKNDLQQQISYTERSFRDTKETQKALEEAIENIDTDFTESISPVSVQTMQMIVGSENLQFAFGSATTTTQSGKQKVTAYTVQTWNPTYTNGTLVCTASHLKHYTIAAGTEITSGAASVASFPYWAVSAANLTPPDPDKNYYLYAVCPKSGTQTANLGYLTSPATFTLSDTSKAHTNDNYYFLIGILNKEHDGTRSFASCYGFTEIMGNRISTDRIVSSDGNTYFDLLNGEIRGNITFTAPAGSDNKALIDSIINSNTTVTTASNNASSAVTTANNASSAATQAAQAAQAAQTEADAASSAAASAQSAANSANTAINTMNNDEVFSILEKKAIRPEWQTIQGAANTTSAADNSGRYKKAVAAVSGTTVSTAALTTAYTNLKTYLNNQALYTNSDTSNFNRTTLGDYFKVYYTEETALYDAIADYYSAQAKDLAQIALGNANTANNKIDNLAVGSKNLCPQIAEFWEQGSTNDESNPEKNYEELKNWTELRLRTKWTIQLKTDTNYIVRVASGYGVGIIKIKNGKGAGWAGFYTGTTKIIPNGLFDECAFVVKKDSNEAITTDDIGKFQLMFEEGSLSTTYGYADSDVRYMSGNENLLPTSSFETNVGDWVRVGTGISFVELDERKCCKIEGQLNNTQRVSYDITNIVTTHKVGTRFTLSGEVKLTNYTGGSEALVRPYFGGSYDGSWMGASHYSYDIDYRPKMVYDFDSDWLGAISGKGWKKFRVSVDFENSPDEMGVYIYGRDFVGQLYFRHLKLELGDEATVWTPAPSDITRAQDSATQAAQVAQSAQTAANNANSAINTMNGDTTFSIVEKKTMRPEWQTIQGAANTTAAASSGGRYQNAISAVSGTTVSTTALTNAYGNLKSYLNTLKLYTDENTSGLNQTTLGNYFKAYYTAETALYDSLADYFSDVAKNLALDSINTLENGGRNLVEYDGKWEQGSCSSEVGQSWDSIKTTTTIRIRTINTVAIKTNTKYTVSIASGYKFELETFKDGGWQSANGGWRTGSYTFDSGANNAVAFLVCRDGNPTIYPDEIWDAELQLEQGTIATQWKPAATELNKVRETTKSIAENAIFDAIEGTTEVSGGLMLTNLLLLKNQSNVVTAGVNGLNSSGLTGKNPRFFAGGTWVEAVAAAQDSNLDIPSHIIPILLTETGWNSNIGIFKVLQDAIAVMRSGQVVRISTNDYASEHTANAPSAAVSYSISANTTYSLTNYQSDSTTTTQNFGFVSRAGYYDIEVDVTTIQLYLYDVRKCMSSVQNSYATLTCVMSVYCGNQEVTIFNGQVTNTKAATSGTTYTYAASTNAETSVGTIRNVYLNAHDGINLRVQLSVSASSQTAAQSGRNCYAKLTAALRLTASENKSNFILAKGGFDCTNSSVKQLCFNAGQGILTFKGSSFIINKDDYGRTAGVNVPMSSGYLELRRRGCIVTMKIAIPYAYLGSSNIPLAYRPVIGLDTIIYADSNSKTYLASVNLDGSITSSDLPSGAIGYGSITYITDKDFPN